MSWTSLIGICVTLVIGLVMSQPCSFRLGVGDTFTVLNAESDNCTRFSTPIPRGLWLEGFSEYLVLDGSTNNVLTINADNGNIYGTMQFRVEDPFLGIAFSGSARFDNLHNCTESEILRELYEYCYTDYSIPTECYQCFDNWTATLTGEGSAAGIIIVLVGRPGHPTVQSGVGANGKNLNTGLSGWCDWEIVEGCASVNCSGRCDINVDLERQLPPSVSGDPHFVGFRGQRYDFHGVADGVFNLITDTNFHLNARFVNADLRPKKIHKTYLGDIGVLIGSHKFQFSCNRGNPYHKILLDNEPLERGVARVLPDEGNAVVLRDASDKVMIDSHPYTIRLWFSSSRHSSCHITMKASYAASSADYPHGVLGQTANPRVVSKSGVKTMQGEGVIEGHWTDYRIDGDDLFGTSFKYNKYDPNHESGSVADDEELGEVLSAVSY